MNLRELCPCFCLALLDVVEAQVEKAEGGNS
jgi:hypothetical protein